MKKILVVCPRFPYPVVGGDKLRIYQICRELAVAHRLTLISFCESKEEMDMPIPEDGVFGEVHRVFLPKWRSYLNTALALLTGKPLQIAYYASPEMQKMVDELLPSHDAVLAHLVRVAPYVEHARQFKILEMTDAISLNYERVRSKAAGWNLKSIIYGVELGRLRNYEKQIVSKFDKTILVSGVDRTHLVSRLAEQDVSKVIVCSNGVDVKALPYHFDPDGQTIVFIGNMVTLQNLDAAEFFAREVMPLILNECHRAVFKIVGKINRADADRLGKYPGVMVTGAVAHIPDAVAGGTVGVCPMRLGAGVQNKILEYMSLGIPAVVSSMGFEGLEATSGQDLLVVDDVRDLAEQVIKILQNPKEWESMSLAGRRYVENYHSWHGKLSPLLAMLE